MLKPDDELIKKLAALEKKLLKNPDAIHSVDKYGRHSFTFRKPPVTLEILLSSNWFGYMMSLDVGGKTFSSGEDTDNYPLTENYRSVHQDIYESLLFVHKAFHANNVYFGKDEKKVCLAFPESATEWRAITYGRSLATRKILNTDQFTEFKDKLGLAAISNYRV